VCDDVAGRVESGASLSSAMAQFPKIFTGFYVNLIRAGELSGTLDETLGYLANQLEKDYDLRSQVIGAMTYPIFILGALTLVAGLMFVFVLPNLIQVLTDSGVDLPITTKILIFISHFLQNFWWVLILFIIGAVIFYRYYSQTAFGRYAIDAIKIKTPFLGKLFVKIYMTRYSRNLSTLIAGGIPIVKALEAVSDIVGNVIYRDIIIEASHQVATGKGIATVLLERPEFPAIVSQMTQVGETTGRLQEILGKLATFYEKETEAELKVVTSLMEPIIMMLLGLAVGVMVAGILLPIYNLAGAA
jgi:type IV pilus assembly protein PilC